MPIGKSDAIYLRLLAERIKTGTTRPEDPDILIAIANQIVRTPGPLEPGDE